MMLAFVLSGMLMVSQAATNAGLHVPHTSSAVMIDGRLSPDEWQNAKQIDVPGVAELYFQQSAEFVYIAVKYTDAPSGIVDLYLSPREGEMYDLHASAKLGERQLHPNSDTDWTWWNNRDWTANTSRVDHLRSAHFFRPESESIKSDARASPLALGASVLN